MSKVNKLISNLDKSPGFEHRLIALCIKSNLLNKDFTKLSGFLELGFNRLNRSRHYKKLVLNGFTVLAEHYQTQGNLVLAFNALQKARELFPFNWDTIQKQIAALNQFVENIDGPISENDLKLLLYLCQDLEKFYSKKKFSKKIASLLSPVYKKVIALYEKIKLDVESPISAGVEKMVMNLYSDLTKEERKKLLGQKIAQTIIEIEKSERLKPKKEKEAKKSKQN